jgi:hypothetical protein
MSDLVKWAVAHKAEAQTQTNKVLKDQVRRLSAELSKRESVKELILQGVKEVFEESPLDLKVGKFKEPAGKHGLEETAVLHLSDTQIGKRTQTYNSKIAAERIQLLAEKTAYITNIRRSAAKIDELHLYLGGDMVEGESIFPHQAHLIDSSVFTQAVKTSPAIITNAVLYFLQHFKRVKILSVPGNHGRNGEHGSTSHPETNWDNVCYEVSKLMLEKVRGIEGRLSFDISPTFWAMDYIYGWGNLVVHGDQMATSSPTSVDKKALNWALADEIPHWNYLWYGHFHSHSYRTVNRLVCLSNGTTESDNDYALGRMAATGYPSQRLSFFAPDYGLIADHQVYLCEPGVRIPRIAAKSK